MKSRDQTSVLLSVLYPPTVKLILFFCPIQPPESTATIYATWTPKHNGVLKTCMASGAQKEVETDQEYLARIVKSWRSKFPKSSVLGENLNYNSLVNGSIQKQINDGELHFGVSRKKVDWTK